MRFIFFILFMGAIFPIHGIRTYAVPISTEEIENEQAKERQREKNKARKEQEIREQREREEEEEDERERLAENTKEAWKEMESYISLLLEEPGPSEKKQELFDSLKSIIEDGVHIDQFSRFDSYVKVIRIFYVKKVLKRFSLSFLNYVASAPTNRGVLIMKILLSKGADIESRDYLRRTPLHNAVIASSVDHVEFLLENGARVNVYDIYGHSPWLNNTPTAKTALSPLWDGAKRDDYQSEAERREIIEKLLKHYGAKAKRQKNPINFCRRVFKRLKLFKPI